ncbi:MAG: flavodoxin [Butyrivibrio sp.]|nr:flavodoxin [Butyrivibrio sp.]
MKTLVIYTSQTGFTKRYAQWIAERMNADIFDVKDVQKKDNSFFAEYEAIVYAGWCMAGKVAKANWYLEKAKEWKGKKLAVVAVGAAPNDFEQTEIALNNILTDEQKTYIKAFYCQGGLNYEKMNLASKLAMKAFAGSLKKSKDPKQRGMGEMVDHSYDESDIKFIEPIIAFLQEAVVA